jgi:hypothetical protein
MHQSGQEVDGVTIFETWQTDKERGILPMKGYEDVPDGSAFASAKVENDAVWADVKAGKLKGFSVEGVFQYARQKERTPEEEQMAAIVDILGEVNKGAGA